jgi:hypothetical protein
MIIGTIGTPAAWAIRTAPLLNPLSSNERDRRFGKHPHDLARLEGTDRGTERGCPRRSIYRDVVHSAHQRAADLVTEHVVLGHEAHKTLAGYRRQSGVGEVKIAQVVDHQNCATGRRDVVRTGDGELQTLCCEQRSRDTDDRGVDRLHGSTVRVGTRPVTGSGRYAAADTALHAAKSAGRDRVVTVQARDAPLGFASARTRAGDPVCHAAARRRLAARHRRSRRRRHLGREVPRRRPRTQGAGR